MDEQISFDGISRILHPENLESFIFELTDGKDYRYGRIFWNVSALVAWIPSLLFGEPGQIFATRMASAVLQAAAFLILTETFVKRNFHKIFCFAFLLFLPFSDYYAWMPKPEPLQLFLLSLFFHYGFKSRFRNPYIWIFWGMSFGAKISTLITLPVCGILFLHSHFRRILELKILLKMSSILFFILLGLCIAVPILFSLNYEPWIQNTFKNTTQSDDSESVNLLTWLEYGSGFLWNIPVKAGILLYILYLAGIFQNRSMFLFRTSESRKRAVALFCSVLFFLSIAFAVKRIWGFYLHFFTVFFIISVFQNIDLSFSASRFRERFYISDVFFGLKDFGLFLLLCWLLGVGFKDSWNKYKSMAHRTESEGFKLGYTRYQKIKEFLEGRHFEKKRPLYIAIDPILFDQQLNPTEYTFEKFWGPFFKWEKKYDYIIISSSLLELTDVKNSLHFMIAKSIIERDRHLILEGKKGCVKKPCYRELNRIEGVRVFSLADVE